MQSLCPLSCMIIGRHNRSVPALLHDHWEPLEGMLGLYLPCCMIIGSLGSDEEGHTIETRQKAGTLVSPPPELELLASLGECSHEEWPNERFYYLVVSSHLLYKNVVG